MGPAGRAPRFRERLLRAGYRQQEALYGGLRSCLAQAFGARSPHWRRQVDQFAASAWCVVMGRHFFSMIIMIDPANEKRYNPGHEKT